MSTAARTSSRHAYLFVSLNLMLLLSFFIAFSLNIRQIDGSRTRYERLVRDWFALRLTAGSHPGPMGLTPEYLAFADDLEELLDSDMLQAAARLSEPLAVSGRRLADAWDLVQRDVAADGASPVVQFESALLGLTDILDEFVELQQRSLQMLLFFLGGTILATLGIFLLVEKEIDRERREALKVQMLARGTIGAQELERERISRALHDSLGQELSVALLELDEADSGEPSADPGRERARTRLRSAVDWIRHLAHELHPTEIDQVGLAEALDAYCGEVSRSTDVGIAWKVQKSVCSTPREVAIGVYRIAQEAITNALRHGRPRNVFVQTCLDTDGLVLSVSDDGYGFRVGSVRSAGIGIIGMRERAAMLKATLEIDSDPERGTSVVLRVPHSVLGCGETE